MEPYQEELARKIKEDQGIDANVIDPSAIPNMTAKDYLEKAGLKEVNQSGLEIIDVSRKIEKAFLDYLESIAEKSDQRWRAIARTHIEEAGMAIRKAISMVANNQT